jgi:ribosome production factor 2
VLKYTRKNADMMPFEPAGELALERHAERGDCSLFGLGCHSKKRPHTLVLGRLFGGRMYDMVEFGVAAYRPIRDFKAAAMAQLGNKPCFVFVGEAFENDGGMRQIRSLMLDFFRGRQVDAVNLAGLDRVVFVTYEPAAAAGAAAGAGAAPAAGAPRRTVLLRQYAVKYKKSGTRVPRAELAEMGPRLDLEVRRAREAAPDMEKEACRRPKAGAKKQKNVGSDPLDGRVGRVYMPKQDVDSIALHKMKGLKRERRAAAADGGGGGEGDGGKRRRAAAVGSDGGSSDDSE